MGCFLNVSDDALYAVAGFDHIHLAAGNHHIAHFHVAEVEHVFQQLQSIAVYRLIVCGGAQYF